MRTTGKSNLKIIAACSVAIFSLLAVLGGAYSWFTLKMSHTIDSNDFAVVNLGSCDLYSIDLYKFEYSTTTHGTGESAFVVTDYLTPELGDVKKYSYDKELKQFGYNDGSWHQVSLMTIYDPVDHLVLGDKLEDMNCNSIYKFVISSNDLTDVYFEASVNKLLNIIPSDEELLFSSCANFDLYYEEDLLDSNPLFTVGDNHHAYYPSYIEYDPDPEAENMSENEGIEEKINQINEEVNHLDPDIRPGVKVGGYLFNRVEVDSHNAMEKARYAFSTLKGMNGSQLYLRYDKEMSNKYKMVQYVVSHIDEAIQKGWIHAYYQPVVFAKDRKLCGVEALARWIDPKYGFLSPGIFVPSLEDSQLAYKLDLAILEIVCQNMRRVLDNGEVIVPTSINFSRADFSVVDIPSEIVRVTSKHNIPTQYLHIEITESALLEEHVDLKEAMNRIKDNGFSIWLDDFGSGYSSFNTLKDYAFDVLKLDLEFLKGFSTNKKSKPLIKAVIDMAKQIDMRTLAEGVETEEQAEFLNSIGCERLQGYLISKPITYEELNDGIANGKFVISKELE